MRTKIAVYVEGLIESGWLLALVVVPLFLNIYSQRVFEPDKLGLLRTIATLMVVGGVALWLERTPSGDETSPTIRQRLGRLWRYPLVRPVALLVVAYLVATALSIAPRVSLWGSYQRLQGTYTLLSYIALFAFVLLYLRRKEQLNRLCTAAILVSLPVALYGLVQHSGLDLLPWAGDVTRRVASTMGNAIFVAAFLIMVIPLTAGRLVEAVGEVQNGLPRRTQIMIAAYVVFLWIVQVWAWATLGVALGIWVGFVCAALLIVISPLAHRPLAPLALAASYSLVLAAQCVTVLFSGSRGPQVGLLVGMLAFALLYVAARHRRALLGGLVAAGVVVAGLLVVINLPDSPLAAVRQLPYVGRLGRILELDQGTGRVRVLIWQGAVDLLADDPARVLVGYGPETMYVAYNRFYPAELAQYEARNASPDRSHNETFDSLITTGILGLAASLILFSSVFYHGIASLGMLPDRRHRIVFGLCAGLGGLGGALAPWLLEGTLRLSGVGLPLGLTLGLLTYVIIQGLFWDERQPGLEGWERLLMVALLAALTAHWVEISVGIAIAATRTYFWVYAALVVLLARRQIVAAPVPQAVAATEERRPAAQARRSRRRGARHPRSSAPTPMRARRTAQVARLVAGSLLVALVLCVMIWDYTTNPYAKTNALGVLLDAFVSGGGRFDVDIFTLGMFWMSVAVFVIGVLITVAELAREQEGPTPAWWGRSLGLCAAIAGGLALIYALAHAGGLTPPVDVLALLGGFLTLLTLLGLGLGAALYASGEAAPRWTRGAATLGALVLLLGALLLAYQQNITPVRADMVYKQGFRYDGEGTWETAATLYERALEMAPQEDYYWLFAGRARLEYGKTLTDPTARDDMIQSALDRLTRARELAPLNTDHTANLARTYRTWAELSEDPILRKERFERATTLYQEAVALSPQNAQLYNEWGQTLATMGDPEGARELFERSLALDENWGSTYMLLGDIHFAAGEWPEMIRYYEKGLEASPESTYGWSRLAYAYAQIEDWDSAIAANQRILEILPNDYTTLRNLVFLYDLAGDYEEALRYLDLVLAAAPAEEVPTLRQIGQELAEKMASQEP